MLANKERISKEILILHGYIAYKRTLLVPMDKESADKLLELDGRKSVCPVDDMLGVSKLPFKITCRMMSHIAKEATCARSYTEAADRINREVNKPISTSTVQRVTDYVGSLVYAEQVRNAKDAEASLPNKTIDKRRIRKRKDDVLYIETDGAMLHVRDKEHVGLENDEISLDDSTKHQPGWTESKHALCFRSEDIKYYYEDSEGRHSGRFGDVLRLGNSIKITGHRIESRDCTGYIGPAEKFQYHLLALAERNNWQHSSKVVLLSDGAKWIKGAKERVFKGRPIIQILDLYHAKENAGKFANWAKRGKKQQQIYADHLCSLIDDGKVDELLEELKPYDGAKVPLGIPNLYTYISNNKEFMDYPKYRKQGLFVGSGAMESANIYMMQDRMKLPGMRWLVMNGRHMLCLKTHYVARTWEEVESALEGDCDVSGRI